MSQPDERKMIPTDVAMVKLLDRMLEEIVQVSKQTKNTEDMMRAQIPEGVIEPLSTLSVTDQVQNVFPPYHTMGKYWFSVKITNDGPDSVYVLINTEKSSNPRVIPNDETWGVEFPTAQIRDIQLWCDSGETASVRITGVR